MSATTFHEQSSETPRGMSREERKVILASSLGTAFEWYDFYLYGALAKIIGAQFFSAFPKSTADIFALLAFAAGFLVRPLGALVFGRIGDLVGRKYTFLMTILIMGTSTFVVGLLPGYASIGVAAPVILILARLLQGLAVGGEYGGAAIYVAEHAPANRRGYYTAWIQTTAAVGLLMALLVILATRGSIGEGAFAAWGWRVPFLLSVVLLGISLWVRLQLAESPAFVKMKAEGATSRAPLKEAFGTWRNARVALIALFGVQMGQAVTFYTASFYALFFLQSILMVDGYTSNVLIVWALVLSGGFFVVFGWLSDKIGRKPIMMAGCLLAVLTYFPVFKAMTQQANPALARAQANVAVSVTADPADCGSLFNPVGTRVFTSSCDIARAALTKSSVRYTTLPGPVGAPGKVKVGDTTIAAYEAKQVPDAKAAQAAFSKQLGDALAAAGYPTGKDPGIVKMTGLFDVFHPQVAAIIGYLFFLNLLATMVYGPIAAALVELFPTRIRYSGMSFPYHLGNGWFGGLLPASAFTIVAWTGDIYAGLWYPIVVAGVCCVVGVLLLPETYRRSIAG